MGRVTVQTAIPAVPPAIIVAPLGLNFETFEAIIELHLSMTEKYTAACEMPETSRIS
jgi:hypothetical protein